MGLLDDLIGGALSGKLGGTLGGALGGALGGTLGGAAGGSPSGAGRDAVPGGSLAKPVILALLALLASGALSRKSAPAGGQAGPGGASGPEGGILGGLGGLLEQFQRGGLGDAVDSWIGRGQNRAISPGQLSHALDPDVIRTLSQQTGLPADQVLEQLSQHLPGLVDEFSPEGELPGSDEEAEDPRLAELSRLSQGIR
ncbi:MAG: DUF937 domain-containing protein [Variibacter sp.]|nr:DUF937 domain-containing protein [Variibacter sp.]